MVSVYKQPPFYTYHLLLFPAHSLCSSQLNMPNMILSQQLSLQIYALLALTFLSFLYVSAHVKVCAQQLSEQVSLQAPFYRRGNKAQGSKFTSSVRETSYKMTQAIRNPEMMIHPAYNASLSSVCDTVYLSVSTYHKISAINCIVSIFIIILDMLKLNSFQNKYQQYQASIFKLENYLQSIHKFNSWE